MAYKFNSASLFDEAPTQLWVPNCIHAELTQSLQLMAHELQSYWDELTFKGWRFFVVNSQRGMCYYEKKVITIPQWVTTKTKIDDGQFIQYVAHEMAHAYAGWQAHHGPEFMKELQCICPAWCIHWELEYKPRNAKSAGISMQSAALDLTDFL